MLDLLLAELEPLGVTLDVPFGFLFLPPSPSNTSFT